MDLINLHEQNPGHFLLEGELTFSTIDKNTLKKFSFLKEPNAITLDLGQITSTDSAGLALIIEWLKIAHDNQTALHLVNMPEQLKTLARLAGVAQMLESADNTSDC